jgi:bifunctional non-homologous end joining protein LigD
VHEIKFDGFRMAARIEGGKVQLLTRSGLDWTAKYPSTAAAFAELPVKTAFIDGELCGVRADGVTSFELMQQSADPGYGGLAHFAFDLLELDGENSAQLPLLQRKERLAQLLKGPPAGIVYSEHESGDGEAFRRAACQHRLEGVVSKRTDRPYLPGDRGAWVKSKCLNRAEFVVVGWSDPERSRHLVGSLLRGYYDPEDPLIICGAGGRRHVCQDTGHAAPAARAIGDLKDAAVLTAAAQEPARRPAGPLPKVHWVRPELVAEITYLGWTDEPLLRHTVFVGLREDKPTREVRREWRRDRKAVLPSRPSPRRRSGQWSKSTLCCPSRSAPVRAENTRKRAQALRAGCSQRVCLSHSASPSE